MDKAALPICAQIHQTALELHHGDITKQDTDAIVNAANSHLAVGGGVDGAIHMAAGPELEMETLKLGGCPVGQAKITKGYRLKARHVIHAVGPIFVVDPISAPGLLESAYRSSLQVAADNGLHSLAFPAISTGIYGYPLDEAAPIALKTACDFVVRQEQITLVRFVLFTDNATTAFIRALDNLVAQRDDLVYL